MQIRARIRKSRRSIGGRAIARARDRQVEKGLPPCDRGERSGGSNVGSPNAGRRLPRAASGRKNSPDHRSKRRLRVGERAPRAERGEAFSTSKITSLPDRISPEGLPSAPRQTAASTMPSRHRSPGLAETHRAAAARDGPRARWKKRQRKASARAAGALLVRRAAEEEEMAPKSRSPRARLLGEPEIQRSGTGIKATAGLRLARRLDEARDRLDVDPGDCEERAREAAAHRRRGACRASKKRSVARRAAGD
jgi:hypothetical protein